MTNLQNITSDSRKIEVALCAIYSIVNDSNADLGFIFLTVQNWPTIKAVCTKIPKKIFCIFGIILMFLKENKKEPSFLLF